jgi:hypothetical protein
MQLLEVVQRDLALDLLKILKPAMPSAELSIVRFAAEMPGFPASKKASDRVKDLVVWLDGVERPGEELLHLIGYLSKPED